MRRLYAYIALEHEADVLFVPQFEWLTSINAI
jgi:hypothetical protein